MKTIKINENLKVQSYQLKQRQSLPLAGKIKLSISRIKHWYEQWEGQVYVAFSGGKDSTVLLHLVRSLYKKVPAVFVDTGLEYPEIRDFVKTIDNVVWLNMNYRSSHYCKIRKMAIGIKNLNAAIVRGKATTKELIELSQIAVKSCN